MSQPRPITLPLPPKAGTVGWALFGTAPHTAWHLYAVFRTRRDARARAAHEVQNGWCDNYQIVKVSFGRVETMARGGKGAE
jgi:hypothetical protein